MTDARYWLEVRHTAEEIAGRTFPVESMAWAAGLFEGQGHIIVTDRHRLAVRMADEAIVRRFCDTLGIGKVYGPYGPYKGKPKAQPFYLWIAENDDARAVAVLLYPWLGPTCRARLDKLFTTGSVQARPKAEAA